MLLIKIFWFGGLYSEKLAWEKWGMSEISFLVFFFFPSFRGSFMYFVLQNKSIKPSPFCDPNNCNVLVSCIFRHFSTDALPVKQRFPSKKLLCCLSPSWSSCCVEILRWPWILLSNSLAMEFHVRKTPGENQSLQKNPEPESLQDLQLLLAISSPAEFPIIPALQISSSNCNSAQTVSHYQG